MKEFVLKEAKKERLTKVAIKPLFVYIFGIDGAGKTTQLKLLMANIRHKNIKIRYVWLRFAALFSVPFYLFSRVIGFTKWIKFKRSDAEFMYTKHRFSQKPFSEIWTWLYTIDLAIFALFKVKIPMLFGQKILFADRYILDAFVDMIYETRGNFNINIILRILLGLLPKRRILFLLDVDEQIAFKRKNDIPSIYFLSKRRNLYIKLARFLNIPIISGEAPVNDIHSYIIRKFFVHYPFWYKN
jgi:dTMP kinase